MLKWEDAGTIADVRKDHTLLPDGKGLYCVYCKDMNSIKFKDISGHQTIKKNINIKSLEDKFTGNRSNIIYIGMSVSIRQKLKQYIMTLDGHTKNHQGGSAVAQIDDYDKLFVKYCECDDPEDCEGRLLCDFKFAYGDYPLANWKG